MKKKILIKVICIIGSFLIVAPLSAYFLIRRDSKNVYEAPVQETVKETVKETVPDNVLNISSEDSNFDENNQKEDDSITVDYFFYTENRNELNIYIPGTVKRDGKTYEYTGETKYDFLESMECIELTMELQVEDKNEVDDTITYTSPETGITYVLSTDSLNFSDLTGIKKKVYEKGDYTGFIEEPDIPKSKTISYINRETGEEEEAKGELMDLKVSEEYWAEAEEPIIGVFERDSSDYTSFGTDLWEGDTEWKINVDLDNTYPSWEGFEKDVLRIAGVPEEETDKYRITGADWLGDKYYDITVHNDKEVLVERRDASYTYEAKCRDYRAEYEGYGQSLGYRAFVSYFTSEEEALEALKKKDEKVTRENIKEDIKTLYRVKATATYREKYEQSASKSVTMPEKAGFLKEFGEYEEVAKEKKDLELLSEYKDYNEDCIGIISIEDTVLNHPLMQSEYDEGFYLTHDLNKEYNSHGVPFLTLDSDLKRDNGNNIIYGHNIRTKERDVFADLAYYEDINYYKEHPIIKLVTDSGTEHYIIFAYYLVDTSDNDFVYWDKTAWNSVTDYKEYMEEVEKRNWFNTDIPYCYSDRFLTLSSCSVELAHSGTNRMVIMARLLKPDEECIEYINNAGKKINPLLPKKL